MTGFPANLFAGYRFAVLGLGRNGLPAAHALAAMGADVVAWDDNVPDPTSPATRERSPCVSTAGEGLLTFRNLAHGPFDFDALVLSPGIPHRLPAPHPVALRARAANIPILSDAELLFQAVRRSSSHARFIGITGTNGKSTTTALLAHILRAADGSRPLPRHSRESLPRHSLPRHSRESGNPPAAADPHRRTDEATNAGTTRSSRDGGSPTAAMDSRLRGNDGVGGGNDGVGDRNDRDTPPGNDECIAAGGNLGPAALALPLLPDNGIYVLEMSSYMLERLATLRFDAAAMLNLSADHLDRHGDMAGYIAAKRAIFDRQSTDDLAVIGVDDPLSTSLAAELGRCIHVSGHQHLPSPHDVCVVDGHFRHDQVGFDFDLRDAPALPGTHNAQNAAAAVAIAMRFVPASQWAHVIPPALASFPGLPHRQQRIATIAGVTFINDSKATNADAAARALACYDRLVWIAGGQAKQGGIDPLAPFFPRIARALLIGRDAPHLATTLAAAGVPHEISGTLETAVPAAFAAARRTGAPVVLLSPACASFDQFTGFDARGDRFATLVHALSAAEAA
ncbi:MAG TPA: UDP-N-acetylmuramoyl-L-alanine--D-glutamate ligase [Acetobacteraceae bacterium]